MVEFLERGDTVDSELRVETLKKNKIMISKAFGQTGRRIKSLTPPTAHILHPPTSRHFGSLKNSPQGRPFREIRRAETQLEGRYLTFKERFLRARHTDSHTNLETFFFSKMKETLR